MLANGSVVILALHTKFIQSFGVTSLPCKVVQDLLTGEASSNVSSGDAVSRPRLHHEHKWTKSSKMMCRLGDVGLIWVEIKVIGVVGVSFHASVLR